MNKRLPFGAILAAALLVILVISPAYGQGPAGKSPVIIAFAQHPGAAEKSLVRGAGGDIKYSYSLVPAIAASLPEAAIRGLLNNPNITAVDADGQVKALDGELDAAWGVKRIGLGTVHLSNKGAGIKVAITD